MSVKMSGSYVGGKKLTLTHLPSSAGIQTVAPKDNNGDGSSFSPTDLIAAGLGSCVVTIIAIVAERSGIDITGAGFEVEKEMVAQPKRRIGSLALIVTLPDSIPAADRPKLERAGAACPVKQSLHPDVQISLEYRYV